MALPKKKQPKRKVKAPAKKKVAKNPVDEEELRDEAPTEEELDDLGPTGAAESEVKEALDDSDDTDLDDLDELEDLDVEGDESDESDDEDSEEELDDEEGPAPKAKRSTSKKVTPKKSKTKAEPKAPTRIAKAGTILVDRTYNGSEEPTEEEQLEIRQFLTFPAQVSTSLGRTIKTAEFESAKVSVSVTLPCYVEELDEAMDISREIASARIGEIVESINSAIDGGSDDEEIAELEDVEGEEDGDIEFDDDDLEELDE